MTTKLPTYDKYKPSGVEWLGEIPEHWEVKKVNYCFLEIGSGTTPTSGNPNFYENGVFNWLQTGDLNDGEIFATAKKITHLALASHSTLRFYPIDSVVIAMYGATIGKTGLLKIQTTTNQACCVLAKPKNVNSKFAFFWLNSIRNHIISLSYGGGQPNINQEQIRNLKIQLPPLSEQTTIAQFLDRKTALIDQAIDIKQKQIELLKERRQILIHQAVTRGLNPEVKMKDSGVEWIGEVPEHWEVFRVKKVFKLIVDPAPQNNGMELLSVYTDIGVKPRAELEERGNRASTTDGYFLVKKGDIIVNKLLAWMGAIGLSDYEGVTSPAYDILRPLLPIEGYFYHNLFRSQHCKSELRKHSKGIMDMRLRLYFDKFGDVKIPYPPRYEQKGIVEYIELIVRKTDTAITLKQQEIAKLQEYKATLINSAVTGKIKVGSYAQ